MYGHKLVRKQYRIDVVNTAPQHLLSKIRTAIDQNILIADCQTDR